MLFLYLIIAWAALIALMMHVVEHTGGNGEQGSNIKVAKKEPEGVTSVHGEKI